MFTDDHTSAIFQPVQHGVNLNDGVYDVADYRTSANESCPKLLQLGGHHDNGVVANCQPQRSGGPMDDFSCTALVPSPHLV